MSQANILTTNMAPLCRLPAELVLQIMRSLSLFDLRNVIAASPGFFRSFLSARRCILQPFTTQLRTEMFQNEHLLSRALLASRLRLLPQADPVPGPMVRSKIETIMQSQPLSPTTWEGSLPILYDLYQQRQEVDQLIGEYATEAWDKLSYDFRRERGIKSPLIGYSFFGPVKLSPAEVYRLEKGFMLFEIHRHSLHYSHPRLLRTKLSPDMILHNWNFCTISETDKLRDWKLRAFQSILRFVLDGYRRLIHEVEHQLSHASPELTQSEFDHVWRFRHRTVHQELLYAVYLSSRGYGLLRNLQKAHKVQLRQFILVSFSAMSFHERPARENLNNGTITYLPIHSCINTDSGTWSKKRIIGKLRTKISGYSAGVTGIGEPKGRKLATCRSGQILGAGVGDDVKKALNSEGGDDCGQAFDSRCISDSQEESTPIRKGGIFVVS
ncbi:hypothetical protein CEP54_016336, partial [Fusarium duplospermum]